jgi:hypothetical protein
LPGSHQQEFNHKGHEGTRRVADQELKALLITGFPLSLCEPSCPLRLGVLFSCVRSLQACFSSTGEIQTHIQPFERGFRKRTHLRIRGAFSARSQLLPAERCGLQRRQRDAREDPLSVAEPRLLAAPRRGSLLLWLPIHSWRLFHGECFSPHFEFS